MLLVGALMVSPKVAVMIHGAGGGGWEYDAWRPVFERAGYRVVAPDLQPVKAGLAATRYEDYVQQVEAWCPQKVPFVLIGASMGGMLAVSASAKTQPSALVLINSVPPEGTGRKAHPPIVEWSKGTLADSQTAMPDSDDMTVREAWRRWRDESGAVLNQLAKGIRPPRPKVPVLVVIGGEDNTCPPAAQRKMALGYGADVMTFPGMSHVGPLLGTRSLGVAQKTLSWCQEKIASKLRMR